MFCGPMTVVYHVPPVHGISQTRILEWVAISSSRGYSWPRDGTCISCIAGRFFTIEPLSVRKLMERRWLNTKWSSGLGNAEENKLTRDTSWFPSQNLGKDQDVEVPSFSQGRNTGGIEIEVIDPLHSTHPDSHFLSTLTEDWRFIVRRHELGRL